MNTINPFLSPLSGMQFYLDPQPKIILSNILVIKEINQSAEILFGVRKKEVLDTNFLEICNDRGIILAIQKNIEFIISGNIYELKEKLFIKNKEPELEYKIVCCPISSASAPNGIYDMITVIFVSAVHIELNEQVVAPDKANTALLDDNSVTENYSLLNLSNAEAFQILPASLWWMNRDHIYKGCNLEACYVVGAKSIQEFIGRDIFDLAKINDWPLFKAQEIYDIDERVMATGIPEFNIESIMPQGNDAPPIHQYGIRKPIFNRHGKVIALMGGGLKIDSYGGRFNLKI